jgi:hypothetical protein
LEKLIVNSAVRHRNGRFQAEKKAALQFWGDAPSESSTNAD